MPWGAIIGAVGAIGGGLLGAWGASSAAKTQANAAMQAAQIQAQIARETLALQRMMFERGWGALTPYRDIGSEALYSLGNFYGLETPGGAAGAAGTKAALEAFRASPEYQFPLQEGLKAVNYSRAAGGMLRNPGTLEALTRYATGYAGGRLDQYLGGLRNLAGMGLSASSASMTGALGASNAMANTMMTNAQMQGQGILNAGAANAAGTVGMFNALAGGVQGGFNNYMLYNYLNHNNPSSFSSNYLLPQQGPPSNFDPNHPGLY